MIDDLITAARSALDTPFRHQGRIVGQGLDCAGLVLHAMRSVGADVFDQQGYSRRAGGGLLEAALDAQPGIQRVTDLQAGDILLMRFSGDPQHLGICAGKTLIHAWAVPGKVCEHDLTEEWQARIVRIYRIKGLPNG